ncbi:iron sulfur cluster binding protein (4Fe-4S ferredoxin family protein) [Desulforapulum autotrophicum HRM2]|uniref:Iron sulfur cluster binding protein (4Fe-4S ferredoxin family protein) n=1 Tax=Desulforapulum autotrophicum (strain ATCC 43914 / DSM 3382 / VKM B-1955 / HRM2) TaxID=177437 RepID=C0QAA3_DESAH|nr:4Fe-4S binding protein [Desulforapulum autotrophicum]ACN14688.1 iron sulfur cluster binding protein (4Fe-4S ferredoxin family protein) [Desulforapulum autotrophicum HRM2]
MTNHSHPSTTTTHSFKDLISMRQAVQSLFLAISLFMGIMFYLFVAQLESGAMPTLERPPGVEAFLPISALISLKYFLFTGVFNTVHPSALVIFLIVCTTALVVRKGFCSWVCPIGLMSDGLAKIHSWLFKRPVHLPTWVDLPLRAIKYTIAGFFVWSVFFKMPLAAVEQFIQSPYNTFADIKMLDFFTNISTTSLCVISVLIILSIIVKNFWCRYLCPYGALLGVISFFSLGKIKRDKNNCIKCGKCETMCPGRISIMENETINSLECSACLRCVDVCPAPNAIGFSLVSGKVPMDQRKIALVIIAAFLTGITTAKATGHWQNGTRIQAYQEHVLQDRMSSQPPMKIPANTDPEKMKRMIERMRQKKN